MLCDCIWRLSYLSLQQIYDFGLSDGKHSLHFIVPYLSFLSVWLIPVFFLVTPQLMGRSGSCAAQSVCEKRSDEGSNMLKDRPSTWPVSGWNIKIKSNSKQWYFGMRLYIYLSVFLAIMSLWKCKLKSLYVLPQESSTSGSCSCSSHDTDISLPGALNSSNTAPSNGNYNRTGILYHGMSGHAAVSRSSQ